MSKARELSVVPQQSIGFKNRIINGAMQISQRGTSFSAVGYTLDRWYFTNGSSATVSQSTDAPTGFANSLSLSATGYPTVVQRIESKNCYDLAGQTVTISFWAKQTSGAGAGSIGLITYYPTSGTDNYGGGVTQINATTFTGSSSWTFYSYTATMPSNVTAGLQVNFYGNTSGAATILITGVQLEKGSTATSFDYRPYGTELQLCQRYAVLLGTLASTSNISIANGTCNGGGAVYRARIPIQVPLRTFPTVTFTNLTASMPGVSAQAVTGITSTYCTGSFNSLEVDISAAGTVGTSGQTGCIFTYTSGGQSWIFVNSEL